MIFKVKQIHKIQDPIEDYVKYSIKQILKEWTDDEKQLLQTYYDRFLNKLKELNILQQFSTLPSTINVIKSTMKHEGNALGYTINNNIVLKELNYSLLAHELFMYFLEIILVFVNICMIIGFKIAHSLIMPPYKNKRINNIKSRYSTNCIYTN